MSKQSDLVSVSQGSGGDPLYIDTTNDRVGVGTTSPAQKLDVSGSIAVSDTTTSTKRLQLDSGASSHTINSANYGSDMMDLNIQAENLKFNTGLIGVAERMRIDSSGGVAVANTRPTTDFDIGGRNMVIGSGSGDQGITIYSSSAGAGNIWFADGGGSTEEIVGGITYDHSGNFLKFRTNNSERLRIDSSGKLLVGRTGPDGSTLLQVDAGTGGGYGIGVASGTTSTVYVLEFRNANGVVGSITTANSATSYNTSSDYRLKENVTPLDGAADRLAQIPVHRFNFIADPDTTVDGFLAHEVQAFVPEAVTGEKDAVETVDVTDEDGNVTGTETRPIYQGIDQSKLVPLLTAALQEALQKIDALEARVAALEAV